METQKKERESGQMKISEKERVRRAEGWAKP